VFTSSNCPTPFQRNGLADTGTRLHAEGSLDADIPRKPAGLPANRAWLRHSKLLTSGALGIVSL
jgi:hypothetical protein